MSPVAHQGAPSARGEGNSVTALLVKWLTARALLAELERAEHPDVVDSYGRTWQWSPGMYVHDGLLAFPLDAIPALELPSPQLAGNPNYAGLCGTCRRDWTGQPW